MRTQTGDVAGTLDMMGPGTGLAAKSGERVELEQRSALERGDVPIPPPTMLAVSTFSGVGGLDRGLELAGIRSVLMAEMDEWCQSVLRHRFQHATVIDDVRGVNDDSIRDALARLRRLQSGADGGDLPLDRGRDGSPTLDLPEEGGGVGIPEGDESARAGRTREVGGDDGGRDALDARPGPAGRHARIDLLHGGFPCQDVSVAGKRAGLDGARTGLFFEFARIAESLRPAWLLLENVPGLLTSNGGRDFGVVLGTLADLGYGVAWRVLDSRYFGVPQRRRRVFIVGRLGGDGASALRALCEGCGGSAEAGPCSWQTPALRARASTRTDGAGRHYFIEDSEDGTLRAGGHAGGPPRSDRHPLLVERAVAGALTSTIGQLGYSGDNPRPGADANGNVRERPAGLGIGDAGDPSYTVKASKPPGVFKPGAWAFQPGPSNGGELVAHRVDTAPALDATAEAHGTDRGVRVERGAVGFTAKGNGEAYEHDQASTLGGAGGQPGQGYQAVRRSTGVRRLTPVECERLQGFPDGWTDVPGLKCPDSRRYAAMGNAVTVNVAEWIGRRIAAEHAASCT